MKIRKPPVISARKRPRQERSERLVADVLEAAVRVLAREGAQRFTTARVAEEAGVSVGSLYQYFPNKEAILFRLQSDEWNQTGALLESILAGSDEPAPDRDHAYGTSLCRRPKSLRGPPILLKTPTLRNPSANCGMKH